MEKEIMINVEGLGKKYKIGEKQRYLALRDTLSNLVKVPYQLVTGKVFLKKPCIWALKDVSFEVKKGEVIGIIGRNGAGKTTLLKILSRITDPTTGNIILNGRVASLLEVGTGFHPELTGRENIYLNGAILGMNKKEIDEKFKDIVEFSGIKDFLDTPVKRYSSGMYVRLAFAVAAHLEPEILLVDEILAVGDVGFQKKCLGKMKDVTISGRTILFVSHNMDAIIKLCPKTIWIDSGRIKLIGNSKEVVEEYLKEGVSSRSSNLARIKNRSGSGVMRFTNVALLDKNNKECDALVCGQEGYLKIGYESRESKKLRSVVIGVGVADSQEKRITLFSNEYVGKELSNLPPKGFFICKINKVPLMPGDYILNFYSEVDGIKSDHLIYAFNLNVREGSFFDSTFVIPKDEAKVLVEHEWSVSSN